MVTVDQIVIVGLLVVAFSLVSQRLARWQITAPMVFGLAGIVMFSVGSSLNVANEDVHLLAELALVVVLFHDASTVQLRELRHDWTVPTRLLAIGFPLALFFTFLVVFLFLPLLGIAGAILLAASITPTDAGLGAPTVLNPVVPVRIRRALNVESGLNDGLATPIVLAALASLSAEEGVALPTFLQIGLVPLALGLLVGVLLGLVGGLLVDLSRRWSCSSKRGSAIGILVLPFLAFGVAEIVGANGFVAAFVGGLIFGTASRVYQREEEAAELLEVGSDLLSYVVWFFAGGLVVTVLSNGFRWQWLVIAVAALTVLRIVPVAIALIGTGFNWRTNLFVGWFGPRGLATIVFLLLTVEELGRNHGIVSDIAGVATVTVALSVVTHGASAAPLSQRFGSWVSSNQPHAEMATSIEPKARGK